jgi:ABC-type transporter Mla subunit MlaD
MRLPLSPFLCVDRAVAMLTGSLDLMERLIAETPRLISDAARLLADVASLVERVDGLLSRVDATRSRTDTVVEGCDDARTRADAVIGEIEGLIGRGAALLAEVEPSVHTAVPLLRTVSAIDPRMVKQLVRLADLTDVVIRLRPLLEATGELDPALVRGFGNLQPLMTSLGQLDDQMTGQFAGAYADVLHRLPTLLAQMTDDVVPSLGTLATAVPDVQELRQIVTRLEPMLVDVELVLAGMPGAGRMRRRGERELEDSSAGVDDGSH